MTESQTDERAPKLLSRSLGKMSFLPAALAFLHAFVAGAAVFVLVLVLVFVFAFISRSGLGWRSRRAKEHCKSVCESNPGSNLLDEFELLKRAHVNSRNQPNSNLELFELLSAELQAGSPPAASRSAFSLASRSLNESGWKLK